MNDEFRLDDLRAILKATPEYEPGHRLRRPFMSAYQIAIRFAERFPNHALVTRLKVGGSGTGEYQSLAQRIARFLSSVVDNPEARGIEGGFLSHDRIGDLHFKDLNGESIKVSTLNSENGHSIFRCVDD